MARAGEKNRGLASPEHWSRRWSGVPATSPVFNPLRRNFRDLHHFYRRVLPVRSGLRFLELGCHPGRYLWYFRQHFGCEVTGIEYIEWCCEQTRSSLEERGVPARIIHADLFDYRPKEGEELWDIVASFGLVEHFSDSRGVLQAHLALTRPGGTVIVLVPNFQRLYGKMMRWAAPEDYPLHRILSLEELVGGIESAGAVEIVEAGYYGRLGFNHTGIHEKMRRVSRLLWYGGRAAAFALEQGGQILPRSARFSPYIAVAARKK